MSYGPTLIITLSLFLTSACVANSTGETLAAKILQSQIPVDTLETINRIGSDAAGFGVPPLYHRFRFRTNGTIDGSNNEVAEAARFIWTKTLRHDADLLITFERTISNEYSLYVLQGYIDMDPNIGEWTPAKIVFKKELTEMEFTSAVQQFKGVDVCDYPVDNRVGLDGEWRSIEYRAGDQYCFASRWSPHAAELSDLGDALIEKFKIPVQK